MVGVERSSLQSWFLPCQPPMSEILPEIEEYPEQVSVQVGRGEFMQFPRLGFGWGGQFRLSVMPVAVHLIDLCLAVQVQPDHHRSMGVVHLAKSVVGEKHPALAPGDAGDSTRIIAPVLGESQGYIVGGSFIN